MIPPEKLDRIAVVGTSGSGKTTLAAQLAGRLATPHIELDALHWGPEWTPRPLNDFRAAVDGATSAPRWICDGNYSMVRDLIWPRATAIVWLDYSLPRVLSRILRRTLRRSLLGTRLFAGNRESLRTAFTSRDSIVLWALQTHGRHRREYPRQFAEPQHAHLHVVQLRTPRQANRLVALSTAGQPC